MDTVISSTAAATHKVENQSPPLENYNAYLSDLALQQAVKREGGEWAQQSLIDFGAIAGSRELIELGTQANENPPRFSSHDARGNRVDQIDFHPSYHRLWEVSRQQRIHSEPWLEPRPGAHVARTAKGYMMCQADAGHGCPVTMTFAGVALLKEVPSLAATWLPLVTNECYDPRNLPIEQKRGATLGMAVTEKQGGSDVYAGTTRATAIGAKDPGEIYELTGHKYFVSGPMGDAFLVLAQTDNGLSCFLVPRWRPDGTKNPMELQQLKRKMGNVSNATAEAELRGAMAWLIGEEGRGLQTILKSITYNRFDCAFGSAAGMRQATAQALHHCQHRVVFGKRLVEQPAMQNVLADLALESEAALTLAMRLARAMDESADDREQELLLRLGTSIGKYWTCKRNPAHAYEAMECIGGSATMETSIMARLYREAPINAIWEGSGNVQALDLMRTIARSPETLQAYLAEVKKPLGADKCFDNYVATLEARWQPSALSEYNARQLIESMALALQASLLLQSDNTLIAEAFIHSRLSDKSSLLFGSMPPGIDCAAIIERATPQL